MFSAGIGFRWENVKCRTYVPFLWGRIFQKSADVLTAYQVTRWIEGRSADACSLLLFGAICVKDYVAYGIQVMHVHPEHLWIANSWRDPYPPRKDSCEIRNNSDSTLVCAASSQ